MGYVRGVCGVNELAGPMIAGVVIGLVYLAGVAVGSWLTGMVWLSWGAGVIFSVAALCCVAAMLIIKDSNVKVCNTLVHK